MLTSQFVGNRRSVWVQVMGLIAGVWFLPPVVHQALHRCPVLHADSVNSAEAVPAFARKYGMSCTQCHTAWPLLNAYGRQFKLNGYVREKGGAEGTLQSQDGSYWTEKLFPWGVVVRSRPYDKAASDNEFKLQAVRDVDLFIAGGDAAKQVSWFGEVDANVDTHPSFQPAVGDVQLRLPSLPIRESARGAAGFLCDGSLSDALELRQSDPRQPRHRGRPGRSGGDGTSRLVLGGYDG